RLCGLELEGGRLRARCLEQKLLPSQVVDLPQQLVDAPAVPGPVRGAAHAASRNSTGSISSTCSRAGRRKTTVTTIAATSSPPSTSSEVWKPSTAAGALETATEWACAKLELALAAIVLTVARPIAPPIWRAVLTRPEATPASERS